MEYKKFVCMVEEKLNLKLEGGMKASKYSVVKNNGMEKTGMILESDEYNIAPAIYLEEFFEQYQKGMSIDRIVNEILEFYENLICEKSGKKAGENIHYLLEMYCQSSIYMTIRWVTGELTCTPEKLAQTVVDGMPGKLAEVFVDLEILN